MNNSQPAEHRQTLIQVLNDVLEQLAFMFGEEVEPAELPAPGGVCVRAEMAFAGPMNGSLKIAVTEEMCPEIAANILGAEPDDDRVMEKARDALKELLNITCGQVLTAIAGEEPVFDLSVPQAAEITPEEWQAMAMAPEMAAVLADDYPVLICLRIGE